MSFTCLSIQITIHRTLWLVGHSQSNQSRMPRFAHDLWCHGKEALAYALGNTLWCDNDVPWYNRINILLFYIPLIDCFPDLFLVVVHMVYQHMVIDPRRRHMVPHELNSSLCRLQRGQIITFYWRYNHHPIFLCSDMEILHWFSDIQT